MYKDIPQIISPAVAWYIHLFIEWNVEQDSYESKMDKMRTSEKINEINGIILIGTITIDEITFLINIEKDLIVKKALKKILNNKNIIKFLV